jgi:hypothetical protein
MSSRSILRRFTESASGLHVRARLRPCFRGAVLTRHGVCVAGTWKESRVAGTCPVRYRCRTDAINDVDSQGKGCGRQNRDQYANNPKWHARPPQAPPHRQSLSGGPTPYAHTHLRFADPQPDTPAALVSCTRLIAIRGLARTPFYHW